MRSLSNGAAVLASGAEVALPDAMRERAARALLAPEATGRLLDDARAFLDYASGPWSPVRAAGALIAMAAAASASDVHIEAEQAGFTIRLRVSGDVLGFADLPVPTGRRLVAALKHVAGCQPYRSDIVQEGRIPREGVAADVRASFMPTVMGERAALRLFGRLLTLEGLGLSPDVGARFEGLLRCRSGLLLVAGPSGGGKTTTVYAALAAVAGGRSGAHLSIEDPVEQRLRIAGVPVDQVEIAPERGVTAEAALSGALRQDVDVIALCEVRTEAEARLALQAAHTGRLVLAGIHAGSTEEAVQRMLDLGADRAVLGTTLRGVLHQHLETVPCPGGTDPGCPNCSGTGRVRRPVADLWTAGEAR